MFKEHNEYWNAHEERKKAPVQTHNKDGSVRQVNQGKYEWRYDETPDKTCVIFEIKLPKHMETANIECDLHPDFVRITAKGKVTQLTHPEFIQVEKSSVQRS